MGRPAPRTITFAVKGPILPSDLEGLCARVCALLERSAPCLALCDVRGVEPNVVTVEALARLQLAAHRRGCRIKLLNASPDLLDLLSFMGLSDVVSE